MSKYDNFPCLQYHYLQIWFHQPREFCCKNRESNLPKTKIFAALNLYFFVTFRTLCPEHTNVFGYCLDGKLLIFYHLTLEVDCIVNPSNFRAIRIEVLIKIV